MNILKKREWLFNIASENTASELILFHSERYWKIAPVSFLFLYVYAST